MTFDGRVPSTGVVSEPVEGWSLFVELPSLNQNKRVTTVGAWRLSQTVYNLWVTNTLLIFFLSLPSTTSTVGTRPSPHTSSDSLVTSRSRLPRQVSVKDPHTSHSSWGVILCPPPTQSSTGPPPEDPGTTDDRPTLVLGGR